MANYQNLLVTTENSITTIAFNRPEKRNAMSPQLHAEMYDLLTELRYDRQTHVIVLTGAGENFCAGQDLKQYSLEMENQPERVREYGLKTTDMKWYVSGHELFIGYDLPVKVERPEKPVQFGQDQPHLGRLLSEGKLDAVIIPGDTGYPAIFGGGETTREMEKFPGVKSLIDDTEEIIRYVRRSRIYPIMHTLAMTEAAIERYPDCR